MLALLAAICASVGVVSHLAMNSYLTAQIDSGLHEAAMRSFGPKGPPPGSSTGLPSPSVSTTIDSGGPNPLDTRGQRPGTIVALFADGADASSAVVQNDGSTLPLTAADLLLVQGLDPNGEPTDLTLSSGHYRLAAYTTRTVQDGMLVAGLSTTERDSILRSLNLVTTTVSVAGLGIIGLAGTIIVRRSLRPLDELSAVATTVASLPLESGEAAIHVRIPPLASQPGTEVGEVGVAFNNMLDHLTRAFAARHAGEVKVRQFVADASHELRTPLTSIRGYTELVLLSERLSPAGASALRRVDSESRRMSALVEDLLLLARLDEGQRGEAADTDLTDLLMETTQDSKVASLDHRWSLQLPEEPVSVHAVESEVRQILINLLSNAAKHTPAGTHVRVSLTAADGVAELAVEDDGGGIPDEYLEQIFTRFSRADPARASSSGNSSGLGLAIVEALAQANGGSVTVTSVPGRTRFTLHLPTV
ncbi:two-component system OmpR family sensor kinase [Arthrobacter stackebrandtii]|uniref:histidine kinase n=1 Tax=Arthrobacter stackebrandtii TaxID=272161 RepID=A0ABS4YVM6_9MICC|nr:HAMP domain-containing sensor histidine kinase [Arthrobacter stackebrandtii]MBP2412852.1 two-component system OmpR family sensor kinase [Arthrobacter stackebrandtii]